MYYPDQQSRNDVTSTGIEVSVATGPSGETCCLEETTEGGVLSSLSQEVGDGGNGWLQVDEFLTKHTKSIIKPDYKQNNTKKHFNTYFLLMTYTLYMYDNAFH